MPKITVLPHPELAPEGAELNVPVGTSICEALLDNGIEIEHACDMSCACTTCHCIVRKGFDSLNEVEECEDDLLDPVPGVSQSGNRTSARSSRRRLQASASSQP